MYGQASGCCTNRTGNRRNGDHCGSGPIVEPRRRMRWRLVRRALSDVVCCGDSDCPIERERPPTTLTPTREQSSECTR